MRILMTGITGRIGANLAAALGVPDTLGQTFQLAGPAPFG